MASYIEYFPQPFLEDLAEGRCIPFIGAGFSRNAVLPRGAKMPLWEDLGKYFANQIPDYSFSTAVDAISAYEHEYSRPKLIEALHQQLHVDSAHPGRTHEAFCSIPFELVVTTNFEFLLERGYEKTSRYCRPVIDEDQLSIESKGAEVRLLKFHGDLHHPTRLIATENDYDSFLEKYPLLATYLANLLIVKTALFVGYSLDDPDFRSVWSLVGNRLGRLRRQAYTISVGASSATIARFERRGVKVINLPNDGERYGDILASAFEELREYWSDRIIETSTTTEDESLAEFSLPKRSVTRLCFFSVPTKLSAYYKKFVFPIAERHGFAPVIAADVLSPGDSISAKVSALIERAEIIVADISTPNTVFEYQLASGFKKSKILAIVEEHELKHIPSDMAGQSVLIHPKGSEAVFLDAIDAWFKQQSEFVRHDLHGEPSRLLEAREYRAAAISGLALIEAVLRRVFLENDDTMRVTSFSRLVSYSVKHNLITQAEENRLRKWMQIRNQAVHMGARVTKAQAESLVKGVMALIHKLAPNEI